MTVKELIEQLQQFNGDLPVWQSKDEEGNGFMSTYLVAGSWADVEQFEPIHPDDVEDWDGGSIDEVVILWP